jgi:hypothetical protein
MKIDIENYESMTPEEKLAALEANFSSVAQHKATADRAASEAAEYKKKLRERMTEDEAKAAKEAEERAALMARVEQLEHEKNVSTYTAAYTAMGYDSKLAAATAEAMANGDTETVLKNQKLHLENREKALRTELLKQTPPPAGGAEGASITKQAFDAMSYRERVDLFDENPELYNKLNGGNE